ncbi:MAG: alpha-amylase [Anaerolineaceae bacterium]|jgi:glycosidase|nr:alpha-amylase [Anaerolineaceae bacterium]MDI9530409.1 alpha-amylase family glycosyl hydrolase [Chloroflexota bacterium]
MEFHITRAARDKYQFDELLFSYNGNVIFANFQASRNFAHKMNQMRADATDPASYIAPGQINALGLIDEIFHLVLDEYYKANGISLRYALYAHLEKSLGKPRLIAALRSFNQLFPPLAVYKGDLSVDEYLAGITAGVPSTENTVEELLMTWLTNVNPAVEPYRELFDDSPLHKNSAYLQIVDGIQIFFKKQAPFGPENQDLVTMLRTPALVVPTSLTGQLEYIRSNWSSLLGSLLYRLLGGLDLLSEEARAIMIGAGGGPGPTVVPEYGKSDPWGGALNEEENFSPDSDWMPKVVMIAKNSFVWLNQLSRQYGRQIDRLDQIPDETLDQLASWGFTGLWLIGLWERSDASRKIKQMCGNPDAVSSAYSLARYQIAERLGGELSYQNLSQRCAARGIRLASDMVPNHMGIDSDWVYDHPEWFIQANQSPFPAYSFNGADLSSRPGISIFLEDHYYSRSDAAVVFKHHDHHTGRTRFIYHGNDGTSMPWNDTAQLNYLNPEVREAVIQTILSVARKFPIIRFDAAMTLTKKHYQRLWFPQPGSGGDIPSRAEYAMTREAFDAAMQEEFWREVVQRVADEVPDTLLLAEAFWLMEGYFVRTLGMHRVYNSAFMNMLRNEENDKYRQLIKNTLVYDPEILKRYVNFMNNPDEKTAVEQYGKGDKYFGICTLLSTMPGLPMFGHGQVEGYSEKYGMEYYRPYWDETPDQDLIRHHQAVIFPLLHQRKIFANVDRFRLYDFQASSGGVDENVFAYSNHQDGRSALVVYHNKYAETAGWIHRSVPFLVKQGSEGHLETQNLADALGLSGSYTDLVLFEDMTSRRYYLRRLQELREKGLFVRLQAYTCQVFMNFKIVSGPYYEQLFERLKGGVVEDLDRALDEIIHERLITPLRQALDINNLNELNEALSEPMDILSLEPFINRNLSWLDQADSAAREIFDISKQDRELTHQTWKDQLNVLIHMEETSQKLGLAASNTGSQLSRLLLDGIAKDPRKQLLLMVWNSVSNIAGSFKEASSAENNRKIADCRPVRELLTASLRSCGFSDYEAYRGSQAVRWLTNLLPAITEESAASDFLRILLYDPVIPDYLEVNTYNGVRWFNKEKFADMLWYQRAARFVRMAADDPEPSVVFEQILAQERLFKEIEKAVEASEYQLDKLLELLD